MYKTIKKAINVLLVAIFLMGAVVFGTMTYKTIDPFDKGYATTDFAGYQPYLIKTDSMEPVFGKDDAIISKVLTDEDEIKVGDIVSYTIGDPLNRDIVIHRVQEINDDGTYTFKGDALSELDVPVNEDQLQAKLLTIVPNFGKVVKFILTPLGALITFTLSLAVVYIYTFIWDILDDKFGQGKDDDVVIEENPDKTE